MCVNSNVEVSFNTNSTVYIIIHPLSSQFYIERGGESNKFRKEMN
nr:MAG TPA: hypothetical protein [Caudoviricetes sp.]